MQHFYFTYNIKCQIVATCKKIPDFANDDEENSTDDVRDVAEHMAVVFKFGGRDLWKIEMLT